MGYKMKELREAMKMTQEELAEKSGVSRGLFLPLKMASTERQPRRRWSNLRRRSIPP